jgi:hypothetical protein
VGAKKVLSNVNVKNLAGRCAGGFKQGGVGFPRPITGGKLKEVTYQGRRFYLRRFAGKRIKDEGCGILTGSSGKI